MLRRWFLAPLALIVLACDSETEQKPLDGSVADSGQRDAGTTPDSGPVPEDSGVIVRPDAGGCGTAPFSCLQACGADALLAPECTEGVWSCPGTSIPSNALDTRCEGQLSGLCRANDTCDGDLACGSDRRCWTACPEGSGAPDCRYQESSGCCGDTVPALCHPLAGFASCPAGTVPAIACTEDCAACPDPTNPRVTYASQDMTACVDLALDCEAPAQDFRNRCGCGCEIPADCPIPTETGVNYVSTDPRQCALLDFVCSEGATPFDLPGCGCGCMGGTTECPDPNDPAVSYVSTDPIECRNIRFSCAPGSSSFSDSCGCGCIGSSCPDPADPDVTYVDRDPATCALLDFRCQPDEQQFSDECGCGCIKLHCPDPTDPTVHYVSQDPSFCATARFFCEADQSPFNDDCGCGCIDAPQCPDPADPTVRYVSQDPTVCMQVRFVCEPGATMFSDACGCGCTGIPPACPDPNDPTVHYVSQDVSQCAATTFVCDADQTMFFDDCGCGCIDNVSNCPDPNDPNVHYVANSPEQCALVRFSCMPGSEPFSGTCGCGCIRTDLPSACALPADVGPCDAAIPRFFHNTATNACEMFTYGGCDGNANNFETEAACVSSCVCQRTIDPGPCRGSFPRWGFDPATGACTQFIYGGCDGNGNNFETQESCEAACVP